VFADLAWYDSVFEIQTIKHTEIEVLQSLPRQLHRAAADYVVDDLVTSLEDIVNLATEVLQRWRQWQVAGDPAENLCLRQRVPLNAGSPVDSLAQVNRVEPPGNLGAQGHSCHMLALGLGLA
jgi:hypothetical protein